MSSNSLNKVEQVRALFESGQTVECMGNTYCAGRTGMQLRLDQLGKAVGDATILKGEGEGQPFRFTLPTRVRDVIAVGTRGATWSIGDGHVVGYRVLA